MAEGFVVVEPEGEASTASSSRPVTANELLRSGLVGLWAKKNIGDSLEFAHTLRSVAEKRGKYK